MAVPFLDLAAQHREIRQELQRAIDEVLDTSSFILGPAVEAFEKSFAAYAGTSHAVGVNSGTSALHLALLALGVGPGDEVIVPAMTFLATAAAVDYTGARPVVVDVEPSSCTLDPARIEEGITERTRAIIPVHLYGQSADMDRILPVARKHGIAVVEDAAQAHGARYRGRPCGSLGDIAAFSFYPGKNLGACGEGGAVTTDREDLAVKVRMLRDWGQARKGEHVLRGFNYRMEGLQGAVLGVKLRHLEGWTEGRRRVADRYRDLLGDIPGLALPVDRGYGRHVYHIYAARVRRREAVQKALAERGIGTGVHYPKPVHLHECFAGLGYREGDFPEAELLAKEELSLPMYPGLAEEGIGEVASALREACAA